MSAGLVPLDQIGHDQCGVVRALGGGTEFASRLSSMGLAVGSSVKVMQNRGHGPLLVLVRETRIALGRGEAMKIMVEEQACETEAADG